MRDRQTREYQDRQWAQEAQRCMAVHERVHELRWMWEGRREPEGGGKNISGNRYKAIWEQGTRRTASSPWPEYINKCRWRNGRRI